MTAALLDRLIVIQRINEGPKNAFGEPAPSQWDALTSAWASRKDVSDAEKVTAGVELSVRRSRFLVRSNALTRSVTTSDRLNVDGDPWDIVGVKERDRNRLIEITAEARSD